MQRLGMDDQALLDAAVDEAHRRLTALLQAHFEGFSAKQRDRIGALIGVKTTPTTPAAARDDEVPRYWLPFSGQTWSGRGRPPREFVAWEGTVAHTAWKKRHPDERFPTFPGEDGTGRRRALAKHRSRSRRPNV
jgi:DNA-binding protein H-NS